MGNPTLADDAAGKGSSTLTPTTGNSEAASGYSLYFHIPFCQQKCDYCHFYVLPHQQRFHDLLMEGLLKEWRLRQALLPLAPPTSIYFGGGTPALLAPKNFATLLSHLNPSPATEITIEANPEDVTLDLLTDFRSLGINRLSIGIQALQDPLLKKLKRIHSAAKALEAVDTALKAGFDNVSVDIIYDLPGQTLEDWGDTLQQIVAFPITHVSLYNLTLEPRSVFYKYRNKISRQMPSSHQSEAMYRYAQSCLSQGDFAQYEISAFARNAKISQHNIGYWTGRPFLGFGPSAYSYWHGQRFRNMANIHRYHRALQEEGSPVDYLEAMTSEERAREMLVVGLRLFEGINLKRFRAELSADTLEKIEELKGHGLMKEQGEHLTLTERGVLVYDAVAAELV